MYLEANVNNLLLLITNVSQFHNIFCYTVTNYIEVKNVLDNTL